MRRHNFEISQIPDTRTAGAVKLGAFEFLTFVDLISSDQWFDQVVYIKITGYNCQKYLLTMISIENREIGKRKSFRLLIIFSFMKSSKAKGFVLNNSTFWFIFFFMFFVCLFVCLFLHNVFYAETIRILIGKMWLIVIFCLHSILYMARIHNL